MATTLPQSKESSPASSPSIPTLSLSPLTNSPAVLPLTISPVNLSQPPPPAPASPPPASFLSTLLSGRVIAGIIGGTLCTVLPCVVYHLCKKWSQHHRGNVATSVNDNSGRQNPPLSSGPPEAAPRGSFTYEELESATNGFAQSKVLGKGAFGDVYRGTLRGREVAIKKLKLHSSQGEKEFTAEINIISRVQNRYVITLVGYCRHEDQRLLVYEYAPNNTLHFHLHESDQSMLDWAKRWNIALCSAKGLANLHAHCDSIIIHRDIKSSNILLDSNFQPKIADFGLARILPPDVTHVFTQLMGTIGYMAPEIASIGRVSGRSDVYAYGVVLLELITGKKPVIMDNSQHAQNLVNWARELFPRPRPQDFYDKLIDERLENYDQQDMQRLIDCAEAAVKDSSESRPEMRQIVQYLEGQISLEELNAGSMPRNSEEASSSQMDVHRRTVYDGITSEHDAEIK